MKQSKVIALAVALATAALIAGALVVRVPSLAAGSESAAGRCEPGRITMSAKVDITKFGHPDGIAIVVANTANNPVPSLGATAQTLLVGFLVDSPKSGKRPYLFSAATGAEKIDYRWTKLSASGTATGTAARVDANLRSLGEALTTAPMAAGLSMFEALAVAADKLASDGSEAPLIILVGSGLDDSGPMNTTTGLLENDPAAVADQIARANPGVDLTGVTVLVQSLGYAQAPQRTATANQRAIITDAWRAVLVRLGATVVIDPAPAPDCSITTDKTVKPTDLPGVRPLTCEGGTIHYELPASVLFGGDSARLRDGVAELLAEPIGILRDNPDTTVELIGHTASSRAYTRKESIKLSTERARAVASPLIDAGIDASRITARGVGDAEPKHEDLNPDGTQNEHAADERRVDMRITGVTTCPDTSAAQPTTK